MNTTQQSMTNVTQAPKKASGCLNALAIIVTIVFVFFAVLGLIGFNIWRVLFNPTLVKHTLTTEIVSSDLAPSLLELFSGWRAEQRVANNESLSGVGEPDVVLLISYVNLDGWREIKQLLVTDEFVTHLISVSVDGFYNWLDSDDLWPNITWDMTPLKERMSGQAGIDAIMVAYSALPACTETQLADFQTRLSKVPPGVEVLYNLCQFPVPWHEDQVNDYVEALKSANENIPVRFNVSEEFGGSSSGGALGLAVAKSELKLVRLIARWGWLISILFLLIILGIRVRSLRSLGQFAGIPLFISGALAILFAWGGQAIIILLVTRSLLAAVSDLIRQEVGSSLKHLTAIFFQPLIIQGCILAGVGMVLIVLIFIKKGKTAR
jgi:hypothetical protein